MFSFSFSCFIFEKERKQMRVLCKEKGQTFFRAYTILFQQHFTRTKGMHHVDANWFFLGVATYRNRFVADLKSSLEFRTSSLC